MKIAFGIGYGFIVLANNDGSIPLNTKALAKIEPGGEEAIAEMQRRANAYEVLTEALGEVLTLAQREYETLEEVEEGDLVGDFGELRERLIERLSAAGCLPDGYVPMNTAPPSSTAS